MKKSTLIIIAMLLLIAGCQKPQSRFELKGEIANFGNDTILIYQLGKDSIKLDTIAVYEGKFSFAHNVDSAAIYMMILPGLNTYPLFVEKDMKIKLEGDSSALDRVQITGGRLNDSYNAFRHSLSVEEEKDSVRFKAESFIINNPYSYVSAFVLEKYFVLQDTLDINKIQFLISSMSGEIQDLPYVKELTETLKVQVTVEDGKRAPVFNVKNAENELVSLNNVKFREKMVLVSFWASWSDASSETNRMIKRLKKKFKGKDIEFVGISLDHDKQSWLDAIKRDTLSWEQLVDFNAWEGSAVKLYGVKNVPQTVLINNRKNIIGKDLSEEELITKLEQIFKNFSATSKRK